MEGFGPFYEVSHWMCFPFVYYLMTNFKKYVRYIIFPLVIGGKQVIIEEHFMQFLRIIIHGSWQGMCLCGSHGDRPGLSGTIMDRHSEHKAVQHACIFAASHCLHELSFWPLSPIFV